MNKDQVKGPIKKVKARAVAGKVPRQGTLTAKDKLRWAAFVVRQPGCRVTRVIR